MRSFPLALIVTVFTLLPAAAFAQGSIAGTARDTSGAMLPGVTVEAFSDALIEKSRSAVTDGSGQYKILDLPPGDYYVVFTLSGFKTVRREGIVIQGTFAAQVNGDLQVGALEETITVTGASPTVDVINNTSQFVADREVLDAIPTAIRNTPSRALLLPGTQVTPFVLGQYTMSVRGSSSADTVIAIDGLRVNNLCGSGQYSGFYMNDAAIQEVTFTTGAESAEMQNGGLRINSTPKDGGNTFSGTFFAYGAGSNLQWDNRSDEVKQFVGQQPGIDFTYQINPSFGGPIKRDKLWFYFTYKYEDFKRYVASSTFADGSRAFVQGQGNYSAVTRLTWAATSRDKFRFYLDRQFNGEDYNGFNTLPTTTPEASTDAYGRGWVPQLKWTQTTSNKLLLDAGISYYTQGYEQSCRPEVGPRDLPAAGTDDQPAQRAPAAAPSRPTRAGRRATAPARRPATSPARTPSRPARRCSGAPTRAPSRRTRRSTRWCSTPGSSVPPPAPQTPCRARSLPCPIGVSVQNTPATGQQKVKRDIGVFVQDTWTMSRLTLNLGGRYDYFNAEIPAQSSAAGPWIQARDFPAIENVPNWHDWSVRLAGTYDLFGTGKTAIKANASKYIASAAAGYAQNFNPMIVLRQLRGLEARVDRLRRQPQHSRRQRQHSVQRSHWRHVELRPDHQSAGSGSPSRLQLGIQRDDPARADAARVGHRRFLSPPVLQPRRDRQPQSGRGRVEPLHAS